MNSRGPWTIVLPVRAFVLHGTSGPNVMDRLLNMLNSGMSWY